MKEIKGQKPSIPVSLNNLLKIWLNKSNLKQIMHIKFSWTLLGDFKDPLFYYLIGYLGNDECLSNKTERLRFKDPTRGNHSIYCNKHKDDHQCVLLASIVWRNADKYVNELSDETAEFYNFTDEKYELVNREKWEGWTLKEAVEQLVKVNEDFFKKCLKIKK